jgi:hypothetical protein
MASGSIWTIHPSANGASSPFIGFGEMDFSVGLQIKETTRE